MNELEAILRQHAKRYPKMQPTDAVKLIYQNEFGGGHLIRDPQAVYRYLHQEYACVKKDPAATRCESIGNGLVRVHLGALSEQELDTLAADFIDSAAAHQGSLACFLEKLAVLRQLTGEGIFEFDADALRIYLDAYAQQGYPMVSHSEIYRQTYRPAYRIIAQKTAL